MLVPLAALASTGGAAAGQPPHVILIMADQHRFDYLGAVNPAVLTPNLDALAGDGVRFSRAYSSTPSSTPARAGLLTGQSPWHHGMIGYYARVAEHYPIELPQLMTNAGYYSYGIGKMHWYPQRTLHGFAATELDESGRVESPGFMSDYRRWFARVAPGLNPDSTHLGWNAHAAAPYALPEALHPTRWTGDRAVAFIENYDRPQPLFLKVSFARPHSPYDPPQRLLDRYEGGMLPPAVAGDWAAPWSERYGHDPTSNPDAAYGDFGAEYAQRSRKYYAANVTFVDEEIGRIIAALKARGMYDNALILFCSDHGDMLGDHYHWRKTYPFEGSAAIPFIVHPPTAMRAGLRGSVLNELVEIRDILPTLVEAAGGTVPAGVDGRSLLPLLNSPKRTPWRESLDLEHSACYEPNSGWVALVERRYKYVWYYQRGEEMLFDLETDPYELHDLHAAPAGRRQMARFRQQMAAHLAERGEAWVSADGQLKRMEKASALSPNYPK